MGEIKVKKLFMGAPKRYKNYAKKAEEELQPLIRKGFKIKGIGCSGAGTGDLAEAHICTVILEKGHSPNISTL